ncbi:cytochrome c peroxidase [Maricaulis parjimensis]|uniref:cytochrome c peroxidase n=1 Tax=Maricaulis parjimensis TaxID=144023 RepID=UPI00193A7047
MFTYLFPGFAVMALAALILAGPAIGAPQSDAAPEQPAEPPVSCGPQVCAQGAALRGVYEGPSADWPAAHVDADIDYVELAPLPRPDETHPVDPELAALGERLFNDPGLSASGQISCATCHSPQMRFADHLRTSFGHDRTAGTRNTPTLLDKAGQSPLMWDGVASSLAEQAILPILNPDEMAADAISLLNRMNADPDYRHDFRDVLGEDAVSLEAMAEALAAFQVTLYRQTQFDRFLRGDHDRLTDQQVFGLHLFRTRARCANCHMGPRLTDDEFHNIGLTYYGRRFEDLGRYAVTGDPDHIGDFRTPSLRHVGETAPYMHNGLFPHLRGIVNIYAAGGARPQPRGEHVGDPLFPKTDPRLHPLDLSPEERDALAAFLESL